MKDISVEEKEIQKNNRLELAKLIMENPDLELRPEIECDTFCDDYAIEIKSTGKARIDEYLVDSNDYVHYKSLDDVFDILERFLPNDEWDKLPETEDECRPFYEALPWKKAIIFSVY